MALYDGKILESLCEQLGASTKEDFLMIGCIWGAFRIVGKFTPFEAAKNTIKLYNETKQQEAK